MGAVSLSGAFVSDSVNTGAAVSEVEATPLSAHAATDTAIASASPKDTMILVFLILLFSNKSYYSGSQLKVPGEEASAKEDMYSENSLYSSLSSDILSLIPDFILSLNLIERLAIPKEV